MTLRHTDAIGAIAIAVVGALVMYGGVTTPDPGFGVVSPAAFPLVLGALMLVSAMWLARDTVGAAVPHLDPIDVRPFVGIVIATGVYLVAFVPLGFILSSAAFFLVAPRILGSRAIVRDVIGTFAFVGGVYLLFAKFLTIDLPHGPLPLF